jgi:hypothetical protein
MGIGAARLKSAAGAGCGGVYQVGEFHAEPVILFGYTRSFDLWRLRFACRSCAQDDKALKDVN